MERFPLYWPPGWPRTPPAKRKWSLAGGRNAPPWDRNVQELLWEVERLGGRNPVLSTNQPLRRDGLLYATKRSIDDPGAALYFQRAGVPLVMARDAYELLEDNIRSLRLAIVGMRQVYRHGGDMIMERVFRGFQALPAGDGSPPAWFDVLGVAPDADRATIERAYRAHAMKVHPDRGGTEVQMVRLNWARTEGLRAAEAGR